MSLPASAGLPLTCSGERYLAVPITTPVRVRSPPAPALAMPKSATFTCPSPRRRMLAGFTSRWTTPWAWAQASASATWTATSIAWATGSWARLLSSWARVVPSTSSMTM